MVTTPEKKPEGLSTKVTIERAGRNVVAGSPVGAVRRIILYMVAAGCVAATLVVGPAAVIVGLVAIILLIATDELR